MPAVPYLTYAVRHDPAHQASPPYQAFMAWCDDEGIPEETGHYITVWNETPIRAILDVYKLDGNGDKIDDGNGGYQTSPVTYNPSTLPPLHNA